MQTFAQSNWTDRRAVPTGVLRFSILFQVSQYRLIGTTGYIGARKSQVTDADWSVAMGPVETL